MPEITEDEFNGIAEVGLEDMAEVSLEDVVDSWDSSDWRDR